MVKKNTESKRKMKKRWNKISYFVKGGLIGLILYVLFVYTSPVSYFGASPNVFGIVLYFSVGAIIGFIVGKIKKKKKRK